MIGPKCINLQTPIFNGGYLVAPAAGLGEIAGSFLVGSFSARVND